MTPAELSTIRTALGWSRDFLGRRVGRSGTSIAEMEHAPGKRAVPVDPDVASYVLAVLAAFDSVSRPVARDRRRAA